MRKIFLTMVVLSTTILVYAQYPLDFKRDNTWVFGYDYTPDQKFGNSIVKFSDSSVDTLFDSAGVYYYLSSSFISDSLGNLILSTNGFAIYDLNLQVVTGGDSINCCNIVFQANYNTGYSGIDCNLIIPQPKNEKRYYVFHKPADINFEHVGSIESRYSIVEITDTTSSCIVKDYIYDLDTLFFTGIEACRHANGRDWWIIQRNYFRPEIYVYLFNENGITKYNTFYFNSYMRYNFGQNNFSPDGTKYIISGDNDTNIDSIYIELFDFDRCSGTLSNQTIYTWKEPDSLAVANSGSSFSPNSKYLYVTTTYKIYQFDMSVPNWQNTKTEVAFYDGFEENGWGTGFGRLQLAPDGKIYSVAGNTSYLHTIDNPNEEGTACNVSQHSFRLPAKNLRSMPNFPPYRMGPIDGSDCDTLGIDMLSDLSSKLDNNSASINLYPNPAKDYITLMIPRISKSWEFIIYDIQGKEVFRNKSRGAFRSYDLSFLASGLYVWKVRYDDGRSENGKLVKE